MRVMVARPPECLLWVISGHRPADPVMSALPSKADMLSAAAKCQKRTPFIALK
jgi:hypothetical protein